MNGRLKACGILFLGLDERERKSEAQRRSKARKKVRKKER
jgi:hypothetical protein